MFAFPDMNKSFNMYTTIVQQFKNNGHEVFILAPGLDNQNTQIKIEANIEVLRVKTLPIKNVPNLVKGISNFLLPYQFSFALDKFYPNVEFDLIISPTPPITLVDVAKKLKRKYKSLFYLILRDIFPQNAVDMGFMKKGGFIFKYFQKKEVELYSIADSIGCMSQGNIDYLIKHNKELNSDKLHILSNYQLLFDISKKKRLDLREKYHFENKFTVVFGGNMGKPQQLENVLELAIYCQKYEDVLFLLLGEGVHMNRLEKEIANRNISNIRIHKTIPKDEYQELLRICDIGLISLHKNFSIPNIPSKSLDYFNVGIPVLASLDRATDFNQILDDTNAGLWSYAENLNDFKLNFEKLYFNRELGIQMGKNGRSYFEMNLTPSIAYDIIITKVNQLNGN